MLAVDSYGNSAGEPLKLARRRTRPSAAASGGIRACARRAELLGLGIRRWRAQRTVTTTLYLVFRDPGPSWVKGLPSRQQPLWDEHAVFMDRLFEHGRIVLAGPYADYSRVLLIVEARDADEASELFRDDPWTTSGILVHSGVIEWTVFLDSRRTGG
jgi:uncharacterized protein YciI